MSCSLRIICVVCMLIPSIVSNTFIWDPSSNSTSWRLPSQVSSPGKCVSIPANLSLCHGIKYNQMRLPNLLHHDTITEVIQQSETWLKLIKVQCHPDTQLFLCSLFSPVCLDQTIPPCRSLCESVKSGCERYMLAHGFSWPVIINCHQFPVDNNMCIQSQALMAPTPGGTFVPPSSSSLPGSIHRFPSSRVVPTESDKNRPAKPKDNDADDEFHQLLLSTICKSDWVIKSGINAIRNNQVRIRKYKTLHGQFTQDVPFSLSLNMTNIVNGNNQTRASGKEKARKPKYIIIGEGRAPLVTKMIVNWQANPAMIKQTLKQISTSDVCNVYKTTPTPVRLDESRGKTRGKDGKRKRGGNKKQSRNNLASTS